MEENNQKSLYFRHMLSLLKKGFPKECSHLSPYRKSTGEIMIRAIVKGKEWLYTTPPNLSFTKADWDELQTDINLKCL